MKIAALLLIGVVALTARVQAQERASEDNAPIAVRTVRGAQSFSIGGVGYNGGRSFAERALRELARTPNPAALFEAILADRNTTSAGRLYALLGLRWTDERQFEARIEPFLRDETQVKVWSGCSVFYLPVRLLSREIERGKYHRPFDLNKVWQQPVRPSLAPRRARLFAPVDFGAGLALRHR